MSGLLDVLLAVPQLLAIGCLWAVLIVTIIACVREATRTKEES